MTIPQHAQLSTPFTVRRHPNADAIQAQASAWAAQHSLEHRNDREHFGIFMACVYPDARPAALRWIANFTVWLFVLDDLCDETRLGSDLAAMRQVHADIIATFSGAPVARAGALTAAAHDLARRLDALQPSAAWRNRFVQCFADYCAGNAWEACNRHAGRVPPLTEYLVQRRHTSSVFVYLCFIELAQGLALTEAQHRDLSRLEGLTNDVVSWCNDVASLGKEVAAGDCHNLVLLLEHERGLDRSSAVAVAISMHNAAVERFIVCRGQLDLQGDLATYADGCEHWMAANARWGAATARYNE